MLKLRSLTVRYGRHTVIDDLNLQLDQGKVVGLLGPNGSGKSSLIRSVAGAQRCLGTVTLQGRKGQQLRDATGYMPQEIFAHLVN